MIVYLLLLIAICLTVSGEVLLKLGMNAVRADVGAFSASLPVLLRTFTDWRVVLGFALIFSGVLFWLGVISRADFSFAYPLLALSYVIADPGLAGAGRERDAKPDRWRAGGGGAPGSWLGAAQSLSPEPEDASGTISALNPSPQPRKGRSIAICALF